MSSEPIDIRLPRYGGPKHGSWTPLEIVRVGGNRPTMWRCRCDCGAERDIPLGNIRSGNSTKCMTCANTQGHHKTHGMSGTKVYRQHLHMIRNRWLCPEWASFDTFYKDFGHLLEPCRKGQRIYQIDKDKPLGPGNATLLRPDALWPIPPDELKTLEGDERRKAIINCRLNRVTLQEIADVLGLTRERVRQISDPRPLVRKLRAARAKVKKSYDVIANAEAAIRRITSILNAQHDLTKEVLDETYTEVQPRKAAEVVVEAS